MSNDKISNAIRHLDVECPRSREYFYTVVYEHLRRLASQGRAKAIRQSGEQSLLEHINATTAIVNEIYLKLAHTDQFYYENRREFFLLVARIIQQILVDNGRYQQADKRKADVISIARYEADMPLGNEAQLEPELMLDLSNAMGAFAENFPRQAQTVQLRYFGGLQVKEIADLLCISESCTEKDLAFAKSWLKVRLQH